MRERHSVTMGNDYRSGNGPEKMVTVGKRLRGWRKSSSMKLVELSSKIHVSQGSLSDLENDKSLPSATTLANLCRFADINIYWLLTGTGDALRKSNTESDSATDVNLEDSSVPKINDQKMKDMVNRLIRVCQHGDPKKKAHIEGFLAGADPDANEYDKMKAAEASQN